MADGVNTGGFVPTQPAIVDTSASFTRLLNIAQRQQERDIAMQLADQQRRQKQMEAQLDIINGFDSSKMVADDRMMFNDAVNQLRMDFVEGRITDPMQFRGRVGKLRNYYGQFTQYAQNPETLAARDNMMKISYYPSELNKANEQLGAGVEYVAGQDIYNERVNAFEHPLQGASYQITPQGDIVVGTPQGNIPVDSLPRQGAQLFVPSLNYTGRGLTIDSMADEAYVLREINAASNLGKYADRSFEGQAMLGSQGGRAAQIGSFTDDRGGFASYPEIEELHITGGRTAVRDLIEQTRTADSDRAKAMEETYDDFLSYSKDEWRKSVLARRPKASTSATQTELGRKRAALLQGGEYLPRTPFMNTVMPESSYTVGILGGESMPLEGGEKGAGDEFFDVVVDPVDIVFFDDGRVGMKYTVKDGDGTIDARYIDRSQRPRLSRYLQGEFGITLDELESAYRRKFPATQPTAQTAGVTDQPDQQYAFGPPPGYQQEVAVAEIDTVVATPTDTVPVATLEDISPEMQRLQAEEDSLRREGPITNPYDPRRSRLQEIEDQRKALEAQTGTADEEELDQNLKQATFRTFGPQAPLPEGTQDVVVDSRSVLRNTHRFGDVVIRVKDWEEAQANPEFRRNLVLAGFLTVPSRGIVDYARKPSRQREIIAKVIKEMNLPTVDV
jgi:hypothetical protein